MEQLKQAYICDAKKNDICSHWCCAACGTGDCCLTCDIEYKKPFWKASRKELIAYAQANAARKKINKAIAEGKL